MLKYVWLLVLAIPPWVAVQFDAPKWVVMVALAPFLLFAMTLGDPDEELLGETSGTFRKGARVVIVVGALVLGIVIFILWQALFPST